MTIAPFPVPPIVKSVTVCAAPARAFALFAERFARWWPLQDHENLRGRLARIEARPSMQATAWDRLLERVAAAA
jgi:hypothetical protein